MGAGKNAQKPITVLVVAAYKEQVVDLKMRFLDLARELELDDEQRSRVQFKIVDNSQGGEADFVFIDLVTTTTPWDLSQNFTDSFLGTVAPPNSKL
ncbi:Ff.00g090050.m01.CDS01 [Fusarium sp. VM40]|nr:Ff.00g090050.m01.CDS01 [Fusarium sp. VM40]